MCWGFLIATVNGFKIRDILHERHSHVIMTPEQEDTYVQFFMPHGITPRQFETLYERAEKQVIPKGQAIIRQGEKVDHVTLVVSGSTRASISGRRLTAASAIRPKSITEKQPGGNSGAWIGEMSFLETYWNKEEQEKAMKAKASETGKENDNEIIANHEEESKREVTDTSSTVTLPSKKTSKPADAAMSDADHESIMRARNRYTIVAEDQCLIWYVCFIICNVIL